MTEIERRLHALEVHMAQLVVGFIAPEPEASGYRAKAKQPDPRPTPQEHAAGAFDPECPDCRSMEAEQPEPVDLSANQAVALRNLEKSGLRMVEPVDPVAKMAEAFCAWPLPENFHPDCGITFEPLGNKGTPHEYRRIPLGTNLLTVAQATEMLNCLLGRTGLRLVRDPS